MSFNAKDMTQGGQIAFMRLRMFTQIGNLIFYCLFIAFFLVAISVLLWRVSLQNLTNGMVVLVGAHAGGLAERGTVGIGLSP